MKQNKINDSDNDIRTPEQNKVTKIRFQSTACIDCSVSSGEDSFIEAQKDHQKLQMVQGLLNSLRLPKTLKKLKQEQKNRQKPQFSEHFNNGEKMIAEDPPISDKIDHILKQSKSFEHMLMSLQRAVDEDGRKQQKMSTQGKTIIKHRGEPFNNQYLEEFLQKLFPRKVEITIPIYRTMQISLNDKEATFLDISQKQSVCFIDNDRFLNVFKQSSQKLSSLKMERRKHIENMKWVTDQLLVLLTSNNSLIFYGAEPLKFIKKLKVQTDKIIYNEIHIINRVLYALTYTVSSFIFTKVDCQSPNNIFIADYIRFQGNVNYLKPLTVCFYPQQKYDSQNKALDSIQMRQHFYGLSPNCRYIVKFDSSLKRAGIFWKVQKPYKIMLLTTSKCRKFLIVVVSCEDKYQTITSESELPLQYEIYHLDGGACLVEKTKHILRYDDFPLSFISSEPNRKYFSKILEVSVPTDKWWVLAFSWQKYIYYLSLKTGKVIYRKEVDSNNVNLRAIGPSNAILVDNSKELIMVSTIDRQKKKAELIRYKENENRNFSQSFLERFSRIQGMPQNLRIMLRSIRGNDLEDLELELSL